MGVLSEGGRIDEGNVAQEIQRLRSDWSEDQGEIDSQNKSTASKVESLIGSQASPELDLYDHILIDGIAEICANSRSMAEAGRTLFNYSRTQNASTNDSHRIKQILDKYGTR